MNNILQLTHRKLLMTTMFVALGMTPRAVHATEPSAASGLYIDIGLAGLFFDTDASIKAAGSHLPGSNLSASNNLTLGIGIGYFVTPDAALERHVRDNVQSAWHPSCTCRHVTDILLADVPHALRK